MAKRKSGPRTKSSEGLGASAEADRATQASPGAAEASPPSGEYPLRGERLLLRLRGRVNDSPMHAEYMMDDAADEIQRLRDALTCLLARFDPYATPGCEENETVARFAEEVLNGKA